MPKVIYLLHYYVGGFYDRYMTKEITYEEYKTRIVNGALVKRPNFMDKNYGEDYITCEVYYEEDHKLITNN